MMKNLLFYCFCAWILSNCGNNTNAPQVSNTAPEGTTLADTIGNDAETILYVVDDFFNMIEKTKSPYAVSQKSDYPLFGFSYSDTALYGFTVHEGGYDTELTFDKNTQKYTGKAIPGLDAFEFQSMPDGNIQLTFSGAKKTWTFRSETDINDALRKVLFEGAYTDTKTGSVVTFKADGTLTGLGAEKTYLPFYDFMGGPLDFDEMEVSDKADPSKLVYYHYKFKGNMLELYETIQSSENEGLPEKIGKLLYALRKN